MFLQHLVNYTYHYVKELKKIAIFFERNTTNSTTSRDYKCCILYL